MILLLALFNTETDLSTVSPIPRTALAPDQCCTMRGYAHQCAVALHAVDPGLDLVRIGVSINSSDVPMRKEAAGTRATEAPYLQLRMATCKDKTGLKWWYRTGTGTGCCDGKQKMCMKNK